MSHNTPTQAQNGPSCGHSACSQHYIDTGSRQCVEQESALCQELADYCTQHGLPLQSADELFLSLDAEGHAKHGAWLRDYIERWDAWEDGQHG